MKKPPSKTPLHDSDNFISIAVIDVSFISLRTVLPSVIKVLTQGNSCQPSAISRQQNSHQPSAIGNRQPSAKTQALQNASFFSDCRKPIADSYCNIIALLKPQFEAGKAHVKKGGIVSDKQVHIETIENLSVFVTDKLGATVRGLTYSPIHKDIGNIEYLLWLTIDLNAQEKTLGTDVQLQQTAVEVVAEAHEMFGNSGQSSVRKSTT